MSIYFKKIQAPLGSIKCIDDWRRVSFHKGGW